MKTQTIDFSQEEKAQAMKTARATGAVGQNAIVPRVVEAIAQQGVKILDFGSGAKKVHAIRLGEKGMKVDAYDFSLPGSEKLLSGEYGMIYASNVLNVQNSMGMLNSTLFQIVSALGEDGTFVANYPQTPRKAGLTTEMMRLALEIWFGSVERVESSVAGANVVFACRKPKCGKWLSKAS